MGRPPKRTPDENELPPLPPAETIEERQNQLIALSWDLAEKQLRDGTASPAVTTYWMRQGTIRERMEQEKLAAENELLLAKVQSLRDAVDQRGLLADAISAFTEYKGQEVFSEDEDYDF